MKPYIKVYQSPTHKVYFTKEGIQEAVAITGDGFVRAKTIMIQSGVTALCVAAVYLAVFFWNPWYSPVAVMALVVLAYIFGVARGHYNYAKDIQDEHADYLEAMEGRG